MADNRRALLRVDSSLHGPSTSVSREIADLFEAAWVEAGGSVVRRDLGAEPLPYLTELEHSAMFVPEEHRTPEMREAQAQAALLADELYACDVLLVTAPLYNLNIPSTLKTWLDRIFTDIRLFPGYGLSAPLAGRSAVVITTRGGGYSVGAPMAGWNVEERYLRTIFADILGYDQRDIIVELTLADVTPAMADLVGIAQANRRNAEDLAQLFGRELAAGGVVPRPRDPETTTVVTDLIESAQPS
jgi:FMN-dependent NADH-azoreductase